MTLGERTRSLVASASSLARRATRRGRHEAQVRQLRWSIDRHKAAIGRAVYPLLETGTVQIDIPEVQEELARIRELHQRLREVEAQWAGERGGPSATPPGL